MKKDHMWEWSTNVSKHVAEEQRVRSAQSWSVFDRVWSTTLVAVTEREVEDASDTNLWYSSTNTNSVQVWGGNGKTTTSSGAGDDNWWALLALALVFGTAAGNILVCLAISWERRLQNVTNYFLMSLAITDLMVAVLVMPLGILTLVRGK